MAPHTETAGRVGFAAKGIVFVLFGVLILSAVQSGRAAPGKISVLLWLAEKPYGKLLLAALMLGLVAYTSWLVVKVFARNLKAVKRAGKAFTAFFYGGLAVWAYRMLMGSGAPSRTEDNQRAHEWTAKLMEQPFGPWLVGAVGLGLVGFGVYEAFKAWREKFWKDLESSRMSPRARAITRRAGRFGITARGVGFAIMGGLLIKAAVRHDPGESVGLSGALRYLAHVPYGPWLLAAVAIGLGAYGVYNLIRARYGRLSLESGR